MREAMSEITLLKERVASELPAPCSARIASAPFAVR